MCAGLPIIVSQYSDGAAETVTEDVNGYIVDPYDTAQFTQAIDRTFTDEQTRKDLAQQAVRRRKSSDSRMLQQDILKR